MTDSSLEVVDFDLVKEKYIQSLPSRPSEVPKSVDAFKRTATTNYFIEFKNGKLDNRIGYEIRRKALESILIMGDIEDATLSDFRDTYELILVYNDKANPGKTPDNEPDRTAIRTSGHLKSFRKTLEKKARKPIVLFGLEPLMHFCFKDVHTCTAEEFDQKFVKKWEDDDHSSIHAAE